MGAGRIETREYYLCTDMDYLKLHDEWNNMHSVGMVKSRIVQGEANHGRDALLCVLTDRYQGAFRCGKKSWGVEKPLHWCLDVTFRENHSRMRKDNTAENFPVVRHIFLNTQTQG